MKNSITPNQEKQYKRLVEDTTEKILKTVDKDELQKLLENGGEHQNDIIASAKKLSIPNQYANEETSSNYTYPKEYAPKPIEEQIQTIAKLFNLSPDNALQFAKETLPTLELPDGAETWFAVPKWEKVGVTYNEAVEIVLAKLGKSRRFKNYREGQLNSRYLRLQARTIAMMNEIAETQKGDILLIPAQLGLRHRGKSVRRARETFVANEFGLGSFIVVSIALTHPERLVRWEELDMDCAGDEYSPDGDGVFSKSLYLNFNVDRVRFDSRYLDDASGHYGSASAWVPAVKK